MENSILKRLIIKFEDKWCNFIGIPNPYSDPFEVWFSPKIPMSDIKAYIVNPDFQYIYDKLWVAKSQNLKSGELINFKKARFPIFIKPRWGHKTAGSKNCYKINNYIQLKPYLTKPDMIWSEYIDEPEKMTDFVLINGNIVFQITYVYLGSVNGLSDEWKLISTQHRPPHEITRWVTTNLTNYTGVLNVQYRGTYIIEAGMRLARGGAYILSTKDYDLIHAINQLYLHNEWDFSQNKPNFSSFYAFKCYLEGPLLYVFPYWVIQYIMGKYDCMPFHEYYFEPVGKKKLCFFQFLHKDFDKGMKVKKIIENLFSLGQNFFIFLFLITIALLLYKIKPGLIVLILSIILYFTRFINPINVQEGTFKMHKIRFS